jgi:hypothetical protein
MDLIEKYAIYRADRPGMRAYLGVGPGWYSLLDETFNELKATGWDGGFYYAKEKYGALEIYLPDQQRFEAITDKCRRLSTAICEYCGALGSPKQGSWIKTLCNNCDEYRNSTKAGHLQMLRFVRHEE